jgi:PleD family two-component response regulator
LPGRSQVADFVVRPETTQRHRDSDQDLSRWQHIHAHSDILRNLALIDPLTGLYNRRFAEQRLTGVVQW